VLRSPDAIAELSVCMFVDRSVVEQLHLQFFTVFCMQLGNVVGSVLIVYVKREVDSRF